MQAIIKAQEITKDFSGVKALDGIDFEVFPQEILGLVGENGAGKSTLMRVLSGVYPYGSFGGQIIMGGEETRFLNPLDAEKAGVAIIHQELSSFYDLSVAENMFVGHLPLRGFLVDWKKMEDLAQHWLDLVGADCTPTQKMGTLSIGTQQLVEIAKALSRQTRVLILDEPTSALSNKECEVLFALLLRLRNEGKGLIYISHKMDEIYKLCDRLVILRDGKSVHTAQAKEIDESALISHMVGRPMNHQFPGKTSTMRKDVFLSVKNLCIQHAGGKILAQDISFDLRAGEILGFAGLLGSGRSEILHSICGDPRYTVKGEIKILDKAKVGNHPRLGLYSGAALVPEDRKRHSIFPKRSLRENISQTRLALTPLFSRISENKENELVEKSIKTLRVKTNNADRTIETLSGGNQQKVIFARVLQATPRIILLDEPTRGVDVGAKFEIYEILFSLAQEGKALIVVSGELPELMGLCDRIGVLHQGKMMKIFERESFDPREIMRYAVGASTSSNVEAGA